MSVGIIIRGKNNEPNRNRLTQKEMDRYFGRLEPHHFKGYNQALGCVVKSKEHFVDLMEKGGFIPYEKGQRLAEEQRNKSRQGYKGVSEKTRKVIADLKATTDSNGKLSSRESTLRAMQDCGVNFGTLNKLPKGSDTDGFYTLT